MSQPAPQVAADPVARGVTDALPRARAIRRDLHRHPELMYRELRTSGVVRAELDALDVPYRAGLAGGTGIVAHLPATVPPSEAGPTIALRADMDALPIDEATGAPYASETAGVMHACGHDGHTAILLGAAHVLAGLPHRPNPVTFLFQPAEEGGGGGARMVADGALAGGLVGGLDAPVARIYGLHGWPDLELGRVGTRPGALLAAGNRFVVTVHGRGGHAALPERTDDPVLAAAHMITAVQSVVARRTAAQDAAVLTVAGVAAGDAFNVIPSAARLVGTIRALDDAVHARLAADATAVFEGVARAFGCRAEVSWDEGFPVTRNDPDATERFMAVARAALGEKGVTALDRPTMGSEDFSFYGREVPACFFFLGLRPAGAEAAPRLHQPDFDFNDDALPTGIELMCRLALGG